MNKKIVITNHTDKFVEWYDILLSNGYTKDDVIIYDRDHFGFNGENLDPKRFEKYGTVIKTPNVGYSIYVMGKYIYDNYENLPDYIIFLKCNILQNNYTTEKNLKKALNSNYFFPIELDRTQSKYNTPFTVNDSTYVESVSKEERSDTKVYPRIKTFPDFIKDLFIIDRIPDYVSFAPGGNYVVPKENILKYSKNFYKKFMYYTDYHHSNVVEAHWYERVLPMIWNGTLDENCSFSV
jgi:hypothetical protein